jgi:transposase-like protein
VKKTLPPSAEIEAQIDQVLAVGVGENPRESLSELAKLGARLIIQRAVEDEFDAWLGRARYERRPDYQRGLRNYESGLRNGYRPRRVQTAEGELEVEIPRVREAAEPFVPALFPHSTKLLRTRPLEAMVVGAFVRGLSMERERVRRAYWKALDEAKDERDGRERLAGLVAELEQAGYASAARCLADDLDALVAHLRYPLRHRKRWRSTNLLGRTLGEVKRRTKVIGRFPGEESCLSLVWAVLDLQINNTCKGGQALRHRPPEALPAPPRAGGIRGRGEGGGCGLDWRQGSQSRGEVTAALGRHPCSLARPLSAAKATACGVRRDSDLGCLVWPVPLGSTV